MITAVCPFCKKTFQFDPKTVRTEERVNFSQGAGVVVVYRPFCTHCNKMPTIHPPKPETKA